MPKQYGFLYDASRCIQCRTCEVSCQSAHNLPSGIKLRRVTETWGGEYPDVTRTFFSSACMHCEKPACAAACPTGAITKRAEDGIVVVDRDRCNGCRECYPACPYGAPQFGEDGIMQKCDFCLGIGREPACTASCSADALRSGDLAELALSAGQSAIRMEGQTGPSVIVIRHGP